MSEMMKAFGMVLDAMKRKEEGRPAPMATCPNCGEPLIGTMRFPGYEFICVECRKLWGFVDPVPQEVTPELQERYKELEKKWEELKKAKEASDGKR